MGEAKNSGSTAMVAQDSLPWSDHHSRRSCLETAESELIFQVLDVNDGSFLCGRCRRLAVLHSRRQGTTGCSSVVTAFRKENKLYAAKTPCPVLPVIRKSVTKS